VTLELSPDSDDDEWDAVDRTALPSPKMLTHPKKKEITQIHIDEVSDGAHNAFTELNLTEEFLVAYSFRRQLFLVVDYMQFNGPVIPFSEMSKATVARHCQRAQTKQQKVRRPIRQRRVEFSFQRFQEDCPVTTEHVPKFLSEYFDVQVLSNVLGTKICKDHELRMMRSVPSRKTSRV
jgi:hypothetical protein